MSLPTYMRSPLPYNYLRSPRVFPATPIYLSQDYDNDLLPMQAVSKQAARWYFASFMFCVTNLLLWMFLAIIMETYR